MKKETPNSLKSIQEESFEDYKKNLLKDANKNMSNLGMFILGAVSLVLAFIFFKFLEAFVVSIILGIVALIILYASLSGKRVEELTDGELRKTYQTKKRFVKGLLTYSKTKKKNN